MEFPIEILNLISEYSKPRYMKPKHFKLIAYEIKRNTLKIPFYKYYFLDDKDFYVRYGWFLYAYNDN